MNDLRLYLKIFFVGAVVTAVGVFFLNPEVNLILGGIVMLGGLVAVVARYLYQMGQVRISQKRHDEILSGQKSLSDTMTGGDGFCFLRFYSTGPNSHSAGFRNPSDFPVHITEVRIINLDCVDKSIILKTVGNSKNVRTLKPSSFMGCSRSTGPIDIPVGRNVTIWNEAVPGPTFPGRMLVNFQTKAGFFVQKILVRSVGKQLLFAFQIERDQKVIFEHTDKGFPIDQKDYTRVVMPEVILQE